jgi:hypothetical protein
MSRIVRPIKICGDLAEVTLTKGYITTIDAADVPLVKDRNWSALVLKRNVYAVRGTELSGQKTMILMHRVLTDAPAGMDVDHKDGHSLNNRQYNLRVCTHGENVLNKAMRSDNKSGFKGVCWETRAQKWRAEISCDGVVRYLGYFASPEEAHAAYSAAAYDLHGQFARVS